MSPAYGYDDEGQREHDCCDVCGSGSCPGSGSGGDDACTYRTPRPGADTPEAVSGGTDAKLSRRPAPPLSPEERAVVARFETAPDPFGDV